MEQDDVPYPCKGCGEILEEGKAFELAGNRWHIDCFRCSTCGTLLDSDAHLLLLGDGALICSNCTYSCSSCGNKIEDLAILTGEQAFCKRCFRCRNCKKEIDNLRYARTSQGIFCMDCHESLMQRRRKRNRVAAAANKKQPGVKLDKSLPSLPPEEETHSRPADDPAADAYADATTEVASRGAAPALDSAKFDDSTPRQSPNDDLILPSSTYRSNRNSTIPREQSEADGGGEFLIPLAFDPNEDKRASSRTQPPLPSHGSSQKSSRDGLEPSISSETASPHIAYQEKGREPAVLEPVRYRPEELGTPDTSSAAQQHVTKPSRSGSVLSAQSDIPMHTRETSSFSTPSPESTRSSALHTRDGSTFDSQRSETTATIPSRPSHELHKLHENNSVDSSRSLPSSALQYPPKRGDSLEGKLHHIPRKDFGTSARPPSVSLSQLDEWHGRSTPPLAASQDQRLGAGRGTPKQGESPRAQRSDSYTDPSRKQHGRQTSLGTVQSDTANRPSDRAGSPSFLRYIAGGDFSMDEDMQRIMGFDDSDLIQNESFLRRMSNSVRHGRSFSDKGSRLSRDTRFPRTPVNGATTTPSQDPPTPSVGSPETRSDEIAWLRSELRKERQRIVEREQKIAELEGALNATADVKLANTELSEKRSTIVVLDTQKEIVMRELSVLTDHLEAEKRGASGALDLGKITNHALREFVDSIQKLKDTFTPQIEELVQKRNDTAEELANLNRLKDKSFQEFEQLSSKNAQLAELNNQLVHQIQELYKANSTEGNRGANGLGIYSHGKDKSLSSFDVMKAASELPSSVSTANMSEEAEATIVPGPQVVSIRKGQPRKFNWKKGGQNVAKGVTKGLKGAFMSSESATAGSQDAAGNLPRSQTQDPSRQGFGFFGNPRNKQGGTKLAQADSAPALSDVAGKPALFGTDLEQRMEHEKSIIPAIVTRCIQEVELRGMDMEGIYRKSGASSAIQTIKEGFEKSPQDYDISDPDLDIHAVTSALKQYFRKLPTPLITYEVYEMVIDSGEITPHAARVEHMRKCLQALPRVHRDVLEFLLFHLARVVERESENLMTSQNVAVVFAPTIMRPESLAREMTDVQKKNEVLKFLVETCQEVFNGMQGLP